MPTTLEKTALNFAADNALIYFGVPNDVGTYIYWWRYYGYIPFTA